MISRLNGTLLSKSPTECILDVGGVGYGVFVPLSVLDRLPPAGQECTLVIHTHVREDQLTLFGFGDLDERALFRLLISISGVGPKIALACLGGLDAARITQAIIQEDAKALSSVPGIGKRTAERIILELKEKVAKLNPGVPLTAPSAPGLDDLHSALRNLGYKEKDVDKLIAGLADKAHLSFEELLREALKRLNA
jgi:Holliday junction DNA helicase RuvA